MQPQYTSKARVIRYLSINPRTPLNGLASTTILSNTLYSKGVHPQSDGRLATIDINASKGFVDLIILCDFGYFQSKKTTKIA